TATKQLDPWAPAAILNDLVLLVGLAAVLALAALDHVDLASTGIERAGVPSAHTEQQQFGDVSKIEADTAAVRAAILTDLVPDDVGDVAEAPPLHYFKA